MVYVTGEIVSEWNLRKFCCYYFMFFILMNETFWSLVFVYSRNSTAFKSVGERVEGAYSSVRVSLILLHSIYSLSQQVSDIINNSQKSSFFWWSDICDDQTEENWVKTKTKCARQLVKFLLHLFLWYKCQLHSFWVTENKYIHGLIFLALFQVSFILEILSLSL